MKNTFMQVACILNDPMVELLLYCLIISYWEKKTSYENIGNILRLKSKFSGKLQRFNTIYGSIKEIIQHSHQIEAYYVSGNKNILTEIYRNIQIRIFNSFGNAVLKRCSANVFSDTNQKHVCWKTCKLRFLTVLRENIFQNVEWV